MMPYLTDNFSESKKCLVVNLSSNLSKGSKKLFSFIKSLKIPQHLLDTRLIPVVQLLLNNVMYFLT